MKYHVQMIVETDLTVSSQVRDKLLGVLSVSTVIRDITAIEVEHESE